MDERAQAAAIMARFAERTGASRRYLWTDAFAVCNELALGHVERAQTIVADVHATLAHHRSDDGRHGWLGQANAEHPTRGGLRIGKPLPERRDDQPADEDLEWERDGQYFHYLTHWMHALDLVARHTRDARPARWARELAETAHASFRHPRLDGGPARLVWKMSIDLDRPLVASQGQHDPLDGLVTCAQLRATAAELAPGEPPSLDQALHGFAAMLPLELATTDPLGIGGLLTDAARVAQLTGRTALPAPDLLPVLLAAAAYSLASASRHFDASAPAARRLGFRELGLAIGLAGLDVVRAELAHEPRRFAGERAELDAQLDALAEFRPLSAHLVAFWSRPEHQAVPSWREHLDINEVMLATALVPMGVLHLPHGTGRR